MATKQKSKKSKKAKKSFSLFSFNKTNLIIFSAVFGVIGTIFLYGTFAAPTSGNLLGTVQPAASQTTETGRKIYALHAWQGKLYAGFGDYSANTGPIPIVSFDLTTRMFNQEAVFSSEAIYIYKDLGGKLFAPAIDSKGADLIRQESTGGWKNINTAGSTHAFDMAELDGKIWMVGSIGKVATVWSSADGGDTWQIAHSVPAERVDSVARFYFIATYKGKLYVQATDGAYPQSTAYSYDPAAKTWTSAPSISASNDFFNWGRKPIEFNGNLLLLEREALSSPSAIIRYDGTGRTMANLGSYTIQGSYFDYAVDGSYLYVLNSEGNIRRTNNLIDWEMIASGPKSGRSTGAGRSLAVTDGKIYVGTFDSKIYEVPIQAPKGGGRK